MNNQKKRVMLVEVSDKYLPDMMMSLFLHEKTPDIKQTAQFIRNDKFQWLRIVLIIFSLNTLSPKFFMDSHKIDKSFWCAFLDANPWFS